jgi:TM2 domain-containing membrane protein YozV
MASRKNKTFATLLAALFGWVGAHRFYLHGLKDKWGWLHASSIPVAGIAIRLWFGEPLLFTATPVIVSFLAGLLAALVIGLTPDDRWDSTHNPGATQASHSGWPLVLLLIAITGGGAIALIAVISRTLDLLFTGGAYG